LGRAEAGFLIGRKGVVSLTSVGNDIQVHPPAPPSLATAYHARTYRSHRSPNHSVLLLLMFGQALVSVTTDKRYKNLERDLRDIADR